MYNIRPDEYQYGEKILDIYSKEEKVRQWLLRELQDKYNYPRALLEVEYKVNNMSRTGSVDICIQVSRDGRLVPYIFCEVKAPGSGAQQALDQLKSYMSNAKHCQYGLATDGREMAIIDVDFNPIHDIPAFHQLSCSPWKDTATVSPASASSTSSGTATCPGSNIETTGSEACSGDKLKLVPTYEEIAAGQPIFMQGKSEARFTCLQNGCGTGENCYLLKVQGDSMFEVIEDQDYVLIQQQSTAENRDIAVEADDEATSSGSCMGDSVLLMPETPSMSPSSCRTTRPDCGRAIGC